MGKVLRVCLAMGGGVSLGSFSGSALTEALKLLILFGKDKKGNPYKDVIIDGMSGASAGAIALTILLRSLMDYESMIDIYNLYELEEDKKINESSLIKELASSYFEGDETKIPQAKLKQLIALQVAQHVQRQIWVKRLYAEELFGEKLNFKADIKAHGSFGLLDRDLLKQLAGDYLLTVDTLNPKNLLLLDTDRVPFACSLTNLLPIEVNGQNSDDLTILEQNVLKSTGSSNHTEIRLIDFKFNKEVEKVSDERWFQFYEDAPDEHMKLDLYNNKAWAVLVASALACGAFPVAFEPVILKRYEKEFAKDEWPAPFKSIISQQREEIEKAKNEEQKDLDILEKSFFDENGPVYIDYNSFNFPYIDGGTFNNEPIREAFRIGSFQDFQNNEGDSDRLVLFVDPAVREAKHKSFNISSFNSVSIKKEESSLKGEFGKLLGSVSGIIGLLRNQGSIKEEHRIKGVAQNLKLRDELFEFVNNNNEIDKRLTYGLVKTVFQKIDSNLNVGMIPVGTRKVEVFFSNELDKTCMQDPNMTNCIWIAMESLEKIAAALTSKEKSKEFPDLISILKELNKDITDPKDQQKRILLFAKTVFKMMADFSLQTVGKNEKAEFMSILPIAPESLHTIELPGDELAAFSGFASEKSRDYTFEYGKLSAFLSLTEKNEGFRSKGSAIVEMGAAKDVVIKNFKDQLLSMPFYDADYKFADEVNVKLLKYGVKRVVQLIFSLVKTKLKWSKFFKGLRASAKMLVGGLIALFAGITGSLKGFKLIRLGLIKFLNGKATKVSEEIVYKKLLPITISILSKEKKSLKIKIETNKGSKRILMVRNDIKAKDGSPKHYQYLFVLHYLEYGKEEGATPKIGKRIKARLKRSESVTINKADSDAIGMIGLTVAKKIENPSIDSNINHKDWREAFEVCCKKVEMEKLKWSGKEVGDLVGDINRKDYSLYYSLKNLNYHTNPMLEYDFDNPTSWYFKENTKAYYLELLEEKQN